MKAAIRILLGVISIGIFILSCTNEYEEKIIGYYQVNEYEPADSSIDLPTLTLQQDKTFILNFKDKKITGTWKANDYGDWTLADFKFGRSQHAQGQILGENFEVIKIVSPLDFDIKAKSFSFKRIRR